MRYEVIFHTSYDGEGKRIGRPSEFLCLPEGVIQEEMPVRTEPPENIVEAERMDGEDTTDYIGTETWEFEVVDGRIDEFKESLKNCPLVLVYSEVPRAA